MPDQQYNADLQPQPSAFYKKILFILLITLLFISLLGAVLWYTGKDKNESPQQAFDSTKQVIPPGAASFEIDQALIAFGFSTPLPFFDRRNVVQSLALQTSASSSPATTTDTYLSYRVFGQDMRVLHSAYIRYLTDGGWKEIASASGATQSFSFYRPGSRNLIQISLDEDMDQRVVSPSRQRHLSHHRFQ